MVIMRNLVSTISSFLILLTCSTKILGQIRPPDTLYLVSKIPIRSGAVIKQFPNYGSRALVNYPKVLVIKNFNYDNDSVFSISEGVIKNQHVESFGYISLVSSIANKFCYSFLEKVSKQNGDSVKCGDFIGLLPKRGHEFTSELEIVIGDVNEISRFDKQLELFKKLVTDFISRRVPSDRRQNAER